MWYLIKTNKMQVLKYTILIVVHWLKLGCMLTMLVDCLDRCLCTVWGLIICWGNSVARVIRCWGIIYGRHLLYSCSTVPEAISRLQSAKSNATSNPNWPCSAPKSNPDRNSCNHTTNNPKRRTWRSWNNTVSYKTRKNSYNNKEMWSYKISIKQSKHSIRKLH